jgi:hypothetical protein
MLNASNSWDSWDAWSFDGIGTPKSMSAEDRDFLSRVAAASPTGANDLFPEEEDELLDLMDRVDDQWIRRIRLGDLPMNVASYFPWRQLKCAPEVFALAMFPSQGPEEDIPRKSKSPAHRALTHYLFEHDLIPNNTILMRPYENGPIEGYIAYVLTRCYDKQTGAGRWVQDSLPKLQQLAETLPPEERSSYLNFINRLMTRSANPALPVYYEYARRRLERDGITDVLMPFLVARPANLIDLRIDLTLSDERTPLIAEQYDPDYPQPPFGLTQADPNYDRIIRVVQRVTGYWDDSRIMEATIQAATKLNDEQIFLDQAIANIEAAMYNVGKEAYVRAHRSLRVAIGRRLYAPGGRGAQEAIADVRQRASQQQH